MSAGTAQAQCVPGLPCLDPLTPNNPYVPPISPNESGPNAPKTEGDMCDADFMNQIYARAWLEAEREHIMAELLVTKPDSTLEYSCFEQINSMTGVIGGPLFSETDYWWNRDILIDGHIGDKMPYWEYIGSVKIFVHMCNGRIPCDKLDISLENLVLTALKSYTDDNFFHDYIGGRATGINNDITGSIGGFYLCDYIYLVHMMAKCQNFATFDQFFSFETLIDLDPRLLPTACGAGTPITQGEIDVAANRGFAYAAFDAFDDTYEDRTRFGACSDPIPTGVKVRLKNVSFSTTGSGDTFVDWDEYDEYVCTNPGCTYVPGQGCQ